MQVQRLTRLLSTLKQRSMLKEQRLLQRRRQRLKLLQLQRLLKRLQQRLLKKLPLLKHLQKKLSRRHNTVLKVLKSYGTAGAVIIGRSGDVLEELSQNEPVFIDFDELPVPFFIESIEPKGGKFVVKFEDIDSFDAAEEIVGRELRLTFENETEEDEDDLVGFMVCDQKGRKIGPVLEFLDYSGNTCLLVDYNGREIILPFHEDLIKKVRRKEIHLTIPDGLL